MLKAGSKDKNEPKVVLDPKIRQELEVVHDIKVR